jgi:hypothetical protein
MAAAWRLFDDRFRIYQYVVKQSHPEFERSHDYANAVVAETTRKRLDHLESKQPGLFSIQLFFVVLLEPGLLNRKTFLRTSRVTQTAATDLQRNRATLIGHIESLQRTIGDLLGIQVLPKREAFSFFRLLANLDLDTARAEHLKYDSHVDFFLPSSSLACTKDGIRIGDAETEVLTLREPPATTFPNILRELISLEANFTLCSEFKRVLNDKAITTVRAAQNHFHWSQWVSDLPSILSMVLNRGKRENVIADKSALNDVEDLDKTLARIKNGGEYLGEFSLTVLLYGWNDSTTLKRAAADVIKIFGNHEASLIRETYNALNAYLAIFPGNHSFNLRRTWC